MPQFDNILQCGFSARRCRSSFIFVRSLLVFLPLFASTAILLVQLSWLSNNQHVVCQNATTVAASATATTPTPTTDAAVVASISAELLYVFSQVQF